MIQTGLYQLLAADQSISQFVGNRIFFVMMPKDAELPAVVLLSVSTRDVYSARGASRLRFARIQFDSYATDQQSTVGLSDAVRTVLQNFSGTLPDGTFVNGCIIQQDMDMPFEPGITGYIFRRLLEVEVQYTEAA